MYYMDAGRNKDRKQDQRQHRDDGKHDCLTFSKQGKGLFCDSERSIRVVDVAFVSNTMNIPAGELRPQPTNLRPAVSTPLAVADKPRQTDVPWSLVPTRHMVDSCQSEAARTRRSSRNRWR